MLFSSAVTTTVWTLVGNDAGSVFVGSAMAGLEKPGADILATLNPEKCSLIHVGPCLFGEAVELLDALETVDDKSIIDVMREELGDFEFYLVANFRHWNMERREIRTFMPERGMTVHKRIVELMKLGGMYWDVVKRAAIYRKPIDVPDPKFNNETLTTCAQKLLRAMEVHVRHLENEYGLSLEEVLEANYIKLADADKGRFKDGYSDQAAQDRADKPDGAKG